MLNVAQFLSSPSLLDADMLCVTTLTEVMSTGLDFQATTTHPTIVIAEATNQPFLLKAESLATHRWTFIVSSSNAQVSVRTSDASLGLNQMTLYLRLL